MLTTKSGLRAEEYRARAEEASASAAGAMLQNNRERHRQAAAIWTGLADAEEARAARSVARATAAANRAGKS
jgi:hypothetical protein